MGHSTETTHFAAVKSQLGELVALTQSVSFKAGHELTQVEVEGVNAQEVLAVQVACVVKVGQSAAKTAPQMANKANKANLFILLF